MTWRERIVEARARGYFTEQDREDAWNGCSCGVGEAMGGTAEGFVRFIRTALPGERKGLHGTYSELWSDFPLAVNRSEFDVAETILDAIEDRVLELKRQAT